MLAETLKARGTRGQLSGKDVSGGTKTEPPEDSESTLAEIGIDRKLSRRAQALASVPTSDFESFLAKSHEGDLNPNRVLKEVAESTKKHTRKKERMKAITDGPPMSDQIIVGDFRDHAEKVTDVSVSLIFTNPPYDRKASKMLPGLAAFAASKLSDGGSMLC